jgi:predicted acylesterase/phospholipase RssA
MEYVFGIPILGYVHEDKWEMFFSMMSGSVIFRNDPLKEYCRRYTGDQTFKEAYDRSAYILNITVTEDSFSTSRLFNYLTTPNVLIWSAVVASCAIPGMFEKVDLYCKTDDGRIVPYNPPSTRLKYMDGSVAGDLPMQRMAEMFNVNTFIVSQVNPHVCPFVSVDNGSILDTKFTKRFLRVSKGIIGNQIKHYLRQMN